MKRKWLTVGIILLFAGTCVLPTMAQDTEKPLPTSRGNWLYVGGAGPGNYSRIQDAVNDSYFGDTIFVFSGIYYENIIINHARITLIGEDRNTTFIDGNNNTGDTIEIFVDEITLKNFTIRNCKYEAFYAGVHLYSRYCIVTENNISKNKVGIFLEFSQDNVISHNSISDNQDGIVLRGSNEHNIISDNVIFSNYGGIASYYRGENNTIQNNDIRNNEYAIHLDSGSQNITITNNSIISHKVGIGISHYCFHTVISNNTISNNERVGIDIYDSFHNSISGNSITDSWRGIDNEFSNNNTITKNYFFHNNEEGILIAESNGTLVFYNIFEKNHLGIYVTDSQFNNFSSNNFFHNSWDAKSFSKGNIWQANYWERPRILPKPIFGNIHTIQFDWHPAQEPYDISGMS